MHPVYDEAPLKLASKLGVEKTHDTQVCTPLENFHRISPNEVADTTGRKLQINSRWRTNILCVCKRINIWIISKVLTADTERKLQKLLQKVVQENNKNGLNINKKKSDYGC